MTDTNAIATPLGIYELWKSGFVNRWHTHPHPGLRNAQDDTGGHSWRMMMLVTMFSAQNERKTKDDLLADLVTILFHDADEVVTGDLAYPFKRANPDVADKVAEFGKAWLAERGVPNFRESRIVKLCDRLDSYLFMTMHAPDLARKDKWVQLQRGLYDEARELGIGQQVKDLVDTARERDWF